MGTPLISDILEVSLFFITLFVSLRSFYVYTHVRNPRLFILGLAMGTIALTGAAEFFSDNVYIITTNTDWFEYIGQSCSLLFIFLSFLRNSDDHFQKLMRLQVLVSVLLFSILLLSTILPKFPNTYVQLIIGSPRFLLSFAVFYCYISAFMTKATRFSLLMSISFALLGFGYLMAVQQYFAPTQQVLADVGDILRLFGLIALLGAVLER